jgi:transducin (beta)-like 1
MTSSEAEAQVTLKGHTGEVNAITWSPGGVYLASCSDDTTAKIWTPEAGLIHTLRGHLKEIFTLRWASTGVHTDQPDLPLLICTASFDGTVKVKS